MCSGDDGSEGLAAGTGAAGSGQEKLQARIAELEPEVAGLRDQAADIRKRFWEEVTVNTSTDEDFEETFYTIKQQ